MLCLFHRLETLTAVLLYACVFSYEVIEEDSERMNLPVYFRERDVKHSGGSSCTMLFGQPFFITVPRHNLTPDTLYECVMERIRLVFPKKLFDPVSTPTFLNVIHFTGNRFIVCMVNGSMRVRGVWS